MQGILDSHSKGVQCVTDLPAGSEELCVDLCSHGDGRVPHHPLDVLQIRWLSRSDRAQAAAWHASCLNQHSNASGAGGQWPTRALTVLFKLMHAEPRQPLVLKSMLNVW
jgi:hypothetical protein